MHEADSSMHNIFKRAGGVGGFEGGLEDSGGQYRIIVAPVPYQCRTQAVQEST